MNQRSPSLLVLFWGIEGIEKECEELSIPASSRVLIEVWRLRHDGGKRVTIDCVTDLMTDNKVIQA